MRSGRTLCLLLTAALAGSACGPPPAPGRTIRFESTAHSSRLANGARILVIEDTATNLVEIGIRLDVGSAADPPGKSGLAHLVEHLMFEVRRDGRPLVGELAAVSLGFNAFTTWEATHYEITARADQLPRVIQLEAQRFASGCEAIETGSFEREREVVRNELRSRTTPFSEDLEALIGAIYPAGHPYRRPVAGSDVDVSALSLADACDFLADNYTADRMVVVVSGNVRARDALALAERAFGSLRGRPTGSLPDRPAAARPRFPLLRSTGTTVEVDLFGAGPMLVVAWPMPPRNSRRHVLSLVALELLQARLPRAMVTTLGGDRAPVAVAAIPADQKEAIESDWLEKALREIDDAVESAVDKANDRRFEAAVNRQARQVLAEFDSRATRVMRLAGAYQAGEGDHIFVFQLELLNGTSRDQVRRAMEEIFGGQRAEILCVPPSGGPRRPRVSSLSYSGRSHDDAWTAPVDPADALRPLRVPLAPSLLERASELTLDNGLRVIMLQTPAVPLLEARLVFSGGSADDPPGKVGLARVTAHALRFKQIQPYGDSAPAYVALHWFGDELDRSVGPDHTTFEVRGLSSHLDAMIAGLASLVIDGRYPEPVLTAWLGDSSRRLRPRSAKQRAVRRLLDAHRRFDRAVHAAIYGSSHPYSQAPSLDDRLRGIRASDVETLRRHRFTARNGVLIVTGRFDPDLVRQHIEHWFDDLPAGDASPLVRPPASPRRPSDPLIAVATDPDEPTATIQIAFGTGPSVRARAARLVVARILEERIGRVRHLLGAAYAVGAAHHENIGPGMFILAATVDATRTGEALQTILAEMEGVRAGGAGIEEAFVRARREVLYHVLAEESGAASVGDRIERLVSRREPLRAEAVLARQLMHLTLADVQPVIARELAAERAVVAVLGPPGSIDAARRVLAPRIR